jgi:fumarate hydratase class II
MDYDLSLTEAALRLGVVSEEEFDRVVDPAKMVRPYVADGPSRAGAAVARG